ncbi:NEK protein kinase [Salpingoeca rosetta]|uniref:non-specific serine/threonine protein kinase n=1 Tax=Salpingoeca rosetta (strain ATCC 50818 / BSB-021) TaxID=946362 RepID=F2UA33_SALR5|nr:NEK protein kinase [Salpingoeca rosetta]EGD73608.1 NEK protein kinase [Salpingoeca rosetta]|eukprot:XP_004993889.1 NEK protein kinase [Salpingoeca rosetta]
MLLPGAQNKMDKYSRVKLLGKGTFGKAWKVRNCEDHKEYVAKQIKCESRQDLKDALQEAEVLSKLGHTHIVSYSKVIQNSPKMVTIIMEYCAGGDVGEKISRRKFRNQYFDENTIQLWIVQAAEALNYLHAKGILHRDVKPANLFLTADATVKLGDFGIARIMDRNAIMPAERTTKTPVGTPMYFSPEMCSGKRYGQKADVWALGCVLYECAALRPAFTATSMDSLTAKIKRGHHDKHLPTRYGHGLRKLIARMLSLDPMHRPTAYEVLHSEYLALAAMENRRLNAAKQPHPHVHDPAEAKNSHAPNIMVIDDDPLHAILSKDMPPAQRKLSPLKGRREKGVHNPPAKQHRRGADDHLFMVEGRVNQLQSREGSRPTSTDKKRPPHQQQHPGQPGRRARSPRDPREAGQAYIPSRGGGVRHSPLVAGQQHQHVRPSGSPHAAAHLSPGLRRKSDFELVRQRNVRSGRRDSPSSNQHPQLHQQHQHQHQHQAPPDSYVAQLQAHRRHSVDVLPSMPHSRAKSPAGRYQFNARQNHITPGQGGGRYNFGGARR